MTLDQTQALFVDALARRPLAPGAVEACFLPSPAQAPAERLEVYQEMFLWRQVDALREDFPKLARLLGEEGFVALGEAFVAEVPSTSPDLGQRGRQLEGFLRSRPALGRRPDAADLAALEWARAEAFFEADAEPVGLEPLAGLTPEAFAALRLELVPSLRSLHLEWDVAALWRALEDEAAPPPPRRRATSVAVWRTGFDVVHARLEPAEGEALRAVAGRAPLGQALEAFTAAGGAAAALEALRSWFADGLVAAALTSSRT